MSIWIFPISTVFINSTHFRDIRIPIIRPDVVVNRVVPRGQSRLTGESVRDWKREI
jgi:hypothetical protein